MRKITPKEVDKLYVFTRQHYVEYYDLQTELVDHLANGIEARWEKNPTLDFQDNLQQEFKKFGVYGFSDIVEKRQRAMEKIYLKIIWQETKKILTRPLVLCLFITLSTSFVFLLQLPQGNTIFMGVFLAFLFAYLVTALTKRYRKRKETLPKKKYLLESIIMQTEQFYNLFLLPVYLFQYANFSDFIQQHTWASVLMGLSLSLFMVIAYCGVVEIPKRKDLILAKVYPERLAR